MAFVISNLEVIKSLNGKLTIEQLAPLFILLGVVIIAGIVCIGIHLTSRKKKDETEEAGNDDSLSYPPAYDGVKSISETVVTTLKYNTILR